MNDDELRAYVTKVYSAGDDFDDERRARRLAASMSEREARSAALQAGARVRALKQITEGGAIGNPEATFPQPGYIHAESGDNGTVVHVENDGALTVKFDHTGTSTIVLPYEIEPITPQNKYLEEIHDENGPTGQVIDVREVRMDDAHFYPDVLDDGIRETVLWLRANGFKTFDSGDGKKDHPCAHDFPNVWMEATRENAIAETDRLAELLKAHGIELNSDGGASLDMTYEPRTQPCIRLFHVDDELLRKHGVIAKTAPT